MDGFGASGGLPRGFDFLVRDRLSHELKSARAWQGLAPDRGKETSLRERLAFIARRIGQGCCGVGLRAPCRRTCAPCRSFAVAPTAENAVQIFFQPAVRGLA